MVHKDKPIIICSVCGSIEELIDDELYEDTYYCKKHENMRYCYDCEKFLPKDQTNECEISIEGDSETQRLCDECRENYSECVSCGCLAKDDDITYGYGDEETLCPDCFDQDYVSCEICNETVNRDDAISFDNGDDNDEMYLCEDSSCYKEAVRRYLQETIEQIPINVEISIRQGLLLSDRIQTYLNKYSSLLSGLKGYFKTRYIILQRTAKWNKQLPKPKNWIIKPFSYPKFEELIKSESEIYPPEWYVKIFSQELTHLIERLENKATETIKRMLNSILSVSLGNKFDILL